MGQSEKELNTVTPDLNRYIRELYGTFLGKFEFFRKWIDVAWSMYDHVNTLYMDIKFLKQDVESLRASRKGMAESLEKAGDEIDELKKQIAFLTQKAPQTTFRKPAEIMDGYFKAINPDK